MSKPRLVLLTAAGLAFSLSLLAQPVGFLRQLVLGTSASNVTLQPAAGTTSYVLTLPSTAGTNGYFLQTNGGGTTTWAAVNLSGFSGIGACGANSFATALNSGAAPTCTQPSFANLSGGVAASQLPNPTTSSLGGVQAVAAVANQFLTSISTSTPCRRSSRQRSSSPAGAAL